jgi:hypothetical protein
VKRSIKSREEWMEEIRRRQDNIDPIRRIPNGALFQGNLINGTLRLNKAQRAGALFIGLSSLAFGCGYLVHLASALLAWSFDAGDLYGLIFGPFSLWMGWKITTNALMNDPTRPHSPRH